MRVKVDPNTCDPVGEPELVGEGRMFDDFCLDQDGGYAYLTTHRQNTIERLSLEPTKNNAKTISIAGDPFTPALIGPSAGHWGRGQGEYGPDRILHDGWRYGLATRGRAEPGRPNWSELSCCRVLLPISAPVVQADKCSERDSMVSRAHSSNPGKTGIAF
jgi:hypothetical protein